MLKLHTKMEVVNEIMEPVSVPLFQIILQNKELVRTHVTYWEKNLKNFVVAYLNNNNVDKDDDILVPKYLVDAPFETPSTIDYIDEDYEVILVNENNKENIIPNYIEEPNHYTVRVRSFNDEDEEDDEEEDEEDDEDEDDEEDDGPPPLMSLDDECDCEDDCDCTHCECECERCYYIKRDEQAYRDFEEAEKTQDNLTCISKTCASFVLVSYLFAFTIPMFLFITNPMNNMNTTVHIEL